MALEDLVRQHDRQTEVRTDAADDSARRAGSLISRVAELTGQTLPDRAEPDGGLPGEDEPQYCADGYRRRSPVQPYCTAEDYDTRRLRRLVAYAVVAALAVLLVIALARAGLLRLR
jgi:hypothetical protein